MLKNKKIYLFTGAIFFALSASFYFFHKPSSGFHDRSHKIRKPIYNFDPNVCPGPQMSFEMNDRFMTGLYEFGEKLTFQMNAFKCFQPKHNQIVLYRYSEFEDPVVKRIVASEGDQFEVIKVRDRWTLVVNSQKVTEVSGATYLFGGEVTPPLGLAAEQRKNRLKSGEVILLSAFSPGDKDSGTYGVIAISDVVGLQVSATQQ